jgi:tetratricopeptide (TPR) repeat protein
VTGFFAAAHSETKRRRSRSSLSFLSSPPLFLFSPPRTPPIQHQHKSRARRRAATRAPSYKIKARLEAEAEELARKALALDPSDGRAYVALGKLLAAQRRLDEARALYDEGATATRGENAHVWQAWATLEARVAASGWGAGGNGAKGNSGAAAAAADAAARKAARLFDAATVADPAHAAAWHGWGLMEKR